MMPDLRALFNQPRRLLPGKGVRMQGYGRQRAIAGVQATGATGVFTLGQVEKSSLMPDMGTDDNPAEMRAGVGVRLHGYGGIHTLELLPVTSPDEAPPGLARLEWEVEKSWGTAHICAYDSASEPDNYIIAIETTFYFENGNIVESVAASGVTTAYGPDDSPPAECAALVETTDLDPEFDYGGELDPSSSQNLTLVSFAAMAALAVGALGVWETSAGSQEWPQSVWSSTPFATALGTVGMTYNGTENEVRADSLRFRLRNRGGAALLVNCGFYGSGSPGGATDLENAIELAPGADSPWQEVPSIDPDFAKYYTAEIRQVRIGQWIYSA